MQDLHFYEAVEKRQKKLSAATGETTTLSTNDVESNSIPQRVLVAIDLRTSNREACSLHLISQGHQRAHNVFCLWQQKIFR